MDRILSVSAAETDLEFGAEYVNIYEYGGGIMK
jgi:hypothetical protein